MGYTLAMGSSDVQPCIDQANASSTVASIDAQVEGLAKNWHPTGFFRPADITTMLGILRDQAADAGAAVASVGKGLLANENVASLKRQAHADMLRVVIDRGKAYEQAVAKANAQNASAVNAPAFKDFVIKAMRSISDAYVIASVIDCIAGAPLRWLNKAYSVLASIAAAAARIIGVAVKIGEGVIDAVDTAGDITAFAIKYAPYAAAAVGAYMLYNLVKKRTA